MNQQRNQWNLAAGRQKFKIFCFDVMFIYLNNRITNQMFLLVLDLLQIVVMLCLYINPIFNQLTNKQLLSYYFEQLYPSFYFFHQDLAVQTFPICSTIFAGCLIVLIIYRKSRPNFIVSIVELLLALVPIMVFRIASEWVNTIQIMQSGLNTYSNLKSASFATGIVFILVAIPFQIVSIIASGKLISRTMDFTVGFLVFCRINSNVVLGLLALKIILSCFFVKNSPCKFIKIRIQCCLLFVVIAFHFIKPVMINYVMLASLIVMCALYQIFTLFVLLQHEDISELSSDSFQPYRHASGKNKQSDKQRQKAKEKDQDKQNEASKPNKLQVKSEVGNYSLSELDFFKKVQQHMKYCVETQCSCRQSLYIKNSSELRAFAREFQKQQLRKKSQFSINNHQIEDKSAIFNLPASSSSPSSRFDYIQLCTHQQTLDFSAYLSMHKFTPTNLTTQYYKYHYLKIYRLELLKQNPRILKISMINQDEGHNPYDDLLEFQNKVHRLVGKVRLFWERLIDHLRGKVNEEIAMNIIEEISEDIDKVNDAYEGITKNYDQKQQADYYYSIFKLLILQQPPSSLLISHEPNYVLITKAQKIQNMTTNLTNLLKKTKSQLIGHNYTLVMHPSYINNHKQWVKNYLENYEIGRDEQFVKVLHLGQNAIKVMKMSHIIMEDYGIRPYNDNDQILNDLTLQQSMGDGQDKTTNDPGIKIITVMHQNLKQGQTEMIDNKQVIFYLLVNRQNLDIVSYQSAFFSYFDVTPTIEQVNKLCRANLKQLFPNLNRQAILFSKGKPLIAKQNLKFFISEEEDIKRVTFKQDTSANWIINKKAMEKLLHVKEVPSSINKQLNLLLLSFSADIQKDNKNMLSKKSIKPLQKQLTDQKTLQKILESQKQQKLTNTQQNQSNIFIEIILCVTFFLIFGIILSIVILFCLQFVSIQPFINFYDKKSQFYTNLQYTKTYFMKLTVGEDRLKQIFQFWSYNQHYSDILTVFMQIDQEVFNKKFQEYVQQFHQNPGYEELDGKVNQILNHIQMKLFAIYILFWACLFLILLNFVQSIVIFIKGETRSKRILSSFLVFNEREIQKNLKRIDDIQTMLQIKQCKNILEPVQQKQIEGQRHPALQLSIYGKKKQFFKDTIKQNTTINLSYIQQRKRGKQKIGFSSKKQRKQKMVLALGQFSPDCISRNEEYACQTSNMMLHKREASNVNFINNDSLINQEGCRTAQRRPGSKNTSQTIKQSQFVRQSSEKNQASKSASVALSIQKNLIYMIPTLLGLALKLTITLFVYFYLSSLLSDSASCIKLKHKLSYQTVFILSILSDQSINKTAVNSDRISQYEKDIMRLINQASRYSIGTNVSELNSIVEFQNQLQHKNTSLCQIIDSNSKKSLSQACWANNSLFMHGMDSLVEFIQENLRKIRIGVLDISYLKIESQLTTALRVCLYIQSLRKQTFAKQYQARYDKQQETLTIVEISLAFIFVLCIYLQSSQLNYTSTKTNRTKNLFKIVPKFMKEQVLRQNLNQNTQLAE